MDDQQRAREIWKDSLSKASTYDPIMSVAITAIAAALRAAPSVEELTSDEKEIALAQAVEFAEYVEQQAKGSMRDAATRFLSLSYSQEVAQRMRMQQKGFVMVEASWLAKMEDFIGPSALQYMRRNYQSSDA